MIHLRLFAYLKRFREMLSMGYSLYDKSIILIIIVLRNLLRPFLSINRLAKWKCRILDSLSKRVKLRHVLRLIKVALRGHIVITADHGELLGEHGMYEHPTWRDFPELREVPWQKLHDDSPIYARIDQGSSRLMLKITGAPYG